MSDKVAKIRALAERGATEGERAAAREALRRLEERGITEETIAAPGVTGLAHMTTDEAINAILNEEDWWRYFAEFPVKSTKRSHNGRVTFDFRG